MRILAYFCHRSTIPYEWAFGESLAPSRSTVVIEVRGVDNRTESCQEVVNIRIEPLFASHSVVPVILLLVIRATIIRITLVVFKVFHIVRGDEFLCLITLILLFTSCRFI